MSKADLLQLAALRAQGVLIPGASAHQFGALCDYAILALKMQRPIEAGWALHYASELQKPNEHLPHDLLMPSLVCHPVWHHPLKSKSLMLIRPQEQHRAFLTELLQTRSFVERYNSFIGNGPAIVEGYFQRTRLQPLQTKQLDWVVVDLTGKPLGLACLADLDFENRRAEWLLGFPVLPEMRQKMVEAAMLLFSAAFSSLRLEKIYGYVYQDNQAAQDATLHLGFQREGVMRSHIRNRLTAQREDLHIFGLLRNEFLESMRLNRIGRKTVSSKYPSGCLTFNLFG
jgi:RimJ/RimL family protein N-acetyltransferase